MFIRCVRRNAPPLELLRGAGGRFGQPGLCCVSKLCLVRCQIILFLQRELPIVHVLDVASRTGRV